MAEPLPPVDLAPCLQWIDPVWTAPVAYLMVGDPVMFPTLTPVLPPHALDDDPPDILSLSIFY